MTSHIWKKQKANVGLNGLETPVTACSRCGIVIYCSVGSADRRLLEYLDNVRTTWWNADCDESLRLKPIWDIHFM